MPIWLVVFVVVMLIMGVVFDWLRENHYKPIYDVIILTIIGIFLFVLLLCKIRVNW